MIIDDSHLQGIDIYNRIEEVRAETRKEVIGGYMDSVSLRRIFHKITDIETKEVEGMYFAGVVVRPLPKDYPIKGPLLILFTAEPKKKRKKKGV